MEASNTPSPSKTGVWDKLKDLWAERFSAHARAEAREQQYIELKEKMNLQGQLSKSQKDLFKDLQKEFGQIPRYPSKNKEEVTKAKVVKVKKDKKTLPPRLMLPSEHDEPVRRH
jgi:hypothetical protein